MWSGSLPFHDASTAFASDDSASWLGSLPRRCWRPGRQGREPIQSVRFQFGRCNAFINVDDVNYWLHRDDWKTILTCTVQYINMCKSIWEIHDYFFQYIFSPKACKTQNTSYKGVNVTISIEGMRVTSSSSSYPEVLREYLLSGKKLLSGPYSAEIQTEKSYLIALNDVKLILPLILPLDCHSISHSLNACAYPL